MEEEVKSKKEQYLERLKAKYPDREFADEEAIYSQINDDYDAYDDEIRGLKDREKSFSDLFSNDPRSAIFLTAWRKGGNPIVELVKTYGEDFVENMKDPEVQEQLAEASKEYAERVAKEKDFEEQYQNNISKTLSEIEALQSEQGLSDDEIDKAVELLMTIAKDGILGKFSRESVLMAIKAINHEADVEVARTEGEILGRNTKIEEKLRKDAKTDGTANLDGKNAGSTPRNMPDMGALDRYANNLSVWERGGEKRIPVKR